MWPTTRRGPRNTACIPSADPPRDSAAVLWRSHGVESVDELLLASGTVYAARPTETVALDATTGDRLWTTAGDGQTMVPASTRVAALGSGILFTVDSERLRAFDAGTGARRWSEAVAEETASPLKGYGMHVTADLVVLGYHGGLAAFDRGDGTHRWAVSPGGLGWTYPAVAHGRLYVGSPGPLYAYERASGVSRFLDPSPSVRWEATGPVFCTWPAVADDRIVVADKEPTMGSGETRVRAVRRDGTLAWRRTVSGFGQAPALTGDGGVVVASGEEPTSLTVFDLGSDGGAVRWQRDLSQFVRAPVVAGDVVLVAGEPGVGVDDDTLRALDAATGETLWTLDVDGSVGSIVAGGERLYLGTDGGVVAVE